MSTPINLNKARKARARAAKSAGGDANAVAYGMRKTDKDRAVRENSRAARQLDGKALETPPYGADDGTKKP
jgi:hypothetical protein